MIVATTRAGARRVTSDGAKPKADHTGAEQVAEQDGPARDIPGPAARSDAMTAQSLSEVALDRLQRDAFGFFLVWFPAFRAPPGVLPAL